MAYSSYSFFSALQLTNYLRLSKIQVGYLLNFNGCKLVFKRMVHT
ncbi:MAG: hypothetical protein JW969_03945 [Spirochaetales bacterium]|nr:hypothetical protein [Spirochaetales bacterium]